MRAWNSKFGTQTQHHAAQSLIWFCCQIISRGLCKPLLIQITIQEFSRECGVGQEHGWAVCGNEVKAVTLCSGREGAAHPREQQG